MPLRGFLNAFWFLLIVLGLLAGLFVAYVFAFPWMLSMVEHHPLVMDAMNYTAPGFVLWGCER